MPKQLKTDKNGNIATCPVLGWTTGTLAEVGIILALDFAEKPEDIQTGGRSVQLALTPQQALQLAEKLTALAKIILEAPQKGKSN